MSLRTRNLTVVRLGGPAPSEDRWVEPVNHSGIRKCAWMGQRARKTRHIERYLVTAKRGGFGLYRSMRSVVRIRLKQASLHTVRSLKRCIGHRTPKSSYAPKDYMPSFTKTLFSSTLTTKALLEATEWPCGTGRCFQSLGLVRLPNERPCECPRTTVARRHVGQYRSDPKPSGRRFVQGARPFKEPKQPWSKPKAQQPLLLQWKALLCKLWRASNGKAQVNGLSKLLTQLTKASPRRTAKTVRRKAQVSIVGGQLFDRMPVRNKWKQLGKSQPLQGLSSTVLSMRQHSPQKSQPDQSNKSCPLGVHVGLVLTLENRNGYRCRLSQTD